MDRSLVRFILEHANDYNWSLQGLGMLRLNIDDKTRLHVWNRRYAKRNVSTIHTHPWHFRSTIFSGTILNIIYEEDNSGAYLPYHRSLIRCGVGGCQLTEPEQVGLKLISAITYTPGQLYSQHAKEIHTSVPEDGTVTLINRTVPTGQDPDSAYVYWADYGAWVSAEPRQAKKEEVADIVGFALQRW